MEKSLKFSNGRKVEAQDISVITVVCPTKIETMHFSYKQLLVCILGRNKRKKEKNLKFACESTVQIPCKMLCCVFQPDVKFGRYFASRSEAPLSSFLLRNLRGEKSDTGSKRTNHWGCARLPNSSFNRIILTCSKTREIHSFLNYVLIYSWSINCWQEWIAEKFLYRYLNLALPKSSRVHIT